MKLFFNKYLTISQPIKQIMPILNKHRRFQILLQGYNFQQPNFIK